MKIVFLDAATIGNDLTYESFEEIGEVVVYPTTSDAEFEEHLLILRRERIYISSIQLLIATVGEHIKSLEKCQVSAQRSTTKHIYEVIHTTLQLGDLSSKFHKGVLGDIL